MEGYKYGFSDDVTPKLQFDEGENPYYT